MGKVTSHPRVSLDDTEKWQCGGSAANVACVATALDKESWSRLSVM